MTRTAIDIEVEELIETVSDVASGYSLIVWNDDVNTFDWVIETLMEVCHHSREQAEQCAIFIHTTGKYAVKNGSFEFLKPRCEAIQERLIQATVERNN